MTVYTRVFSLVVLQFELYNSCLKSKLTDHVDLYTYIYMTQFELIQKNQYESPYIVKLYSKWMCLQEHRISRSVAADNATCIQRQIAEKFFIAPSQGIG